MADAMPTPNADAILAEIDKLAQALPCPWQRRRLAVLRCQLVLLVREAQAKQVDTPGPALFP